MTKLLEIRGAEDSYDEFVRAVMAAADKHPNRWFSRRNAEKWQAIKDVYTEFVPQFMAEGVDVYLCGLREELPGRRGPKIQLTPWLEFVDTTTNPEYQPKHVWEEDLESCPLM